MNTKLSKYLFLALVVAIPFGNLLRFEDLFGINGANVLVVDVIALLSIFLLEKGKNIFRKYFGVLILYLLFGSILSLTKYPAGEVLVSMGYLLRLVSYFFFFSLIFGIISSLEDRLWIYRYIFLSIFVLSVAGWVQYFIFPDLTQLKLLGWDDHAYRMASTLLDPNYLGAVFLIAVAISNYFYIRSKKNIYAIISVYFVISILFTYSRATYLAMFVLVVATALNDIKYRKFLVFLTSALMLVFFLPRYESEGVKLERLHSIFTRIDNYKQTLKIVSDQPLFGVGYNNLCLYKGEFGTFSKSCGGSDSSILYILATSGVVGFILFIEAVVLIYKRSQRSEYILLLPLFSALLTHSFFNNTLFYPFVLLPILLLAAAAKDNLRIESDS